MTVYRKGGTTRRGFLGVVVVTAAGVILAPDLLAEEAKLVDLNDPLVKGLKYAHSHAGVEKSLQVARMGVPFEQQFCNNCIHYKQTAEIGGEKAGTCALMPGKGLVKDKGWCNVWAKKP